MLNNQLTGGFLIATLNSVEINACRQFTHIEVEIVFTTLAGEGLSNYTLTHHVH